MLEILFLGLLAARCFAGSTQSFLTDQHDNNCGDSLFHTHSGQCDQTILTLETLKDVPSPPLEVHPLIVSGPSHNRVDLVFFSDGYLLEEKNKFIQDALRLAQDISANQTFATVNPLLNFWAAFSPSNESGVGVGGKPKDTPFGLYRDGTELRAVYYSKPEAARAACRFLHEQCDYPILLGNDPHYGGLGGDFTVITSSLANGPLVLRHELGHSIIEVGEEYDGGFAYFGVNAYHDLSKPVPWAHWLSSEDQVQPPRVEQSVMPMQEYPWTLLNVSTPWSITFESSGMYAWHLMKFSLSGLPESSDLRIELDVVDLGWVPRKDIGLDRWLYEIAGSESLDAGLHEIKFVLLNEEREGVAQLCSVEMLELGPEETFISTPGHYGVYPTFSEDNKTTYRPTNDDCLMRSVTTPNFCKVCIEGLWLSLLKNIKLIDSVKEGCERRQASESDQGTSSGWVKTLELELLPLAQFRKDGARVNESYAIRWWKGRQALEEFANQTSIELDDESAVGTYSIDVTFITDEVRVDENDHLTTRDFIHQVKHRCS